MRPLEEELLPFVFQSVFVVVVGSLPVFCQVVYSIFEDADPLDEVFCEDYCFMLLLFMT